MNHKNNPSLQFPVWLPSHVVTHARKIITELSPKEEIKACLARLTTHPDMRAVWNAIQKTFVDPNDLIEFLEYIRLHPAVTNQISLTDIPSHAKENKAFSDISKYSSLTLNSLRDLTPTKNLEQGLRMLDAALERLEADAVLNTTKNHIKTFELRRILKQAQQQSIDFITTLMALQDAASLAMQAPSTNLPRKRNTDNAHIVWLVKDTSQYFKKRLKSPQYQLVADTVNTALALHDDALDAERVRGMLR